MARHTLNLMTPGAARQPMFRHTETPVPATLDEMLAANAEDEDLCDWLRTAQVGDHFPSLTNLRRAA